MTGYLRSLLAKRNSGQNAIVPRLPARFEPGGRGPSMANPFDAPFVDDHAIAGQPADLPSGPAQRPDRQRRTGLFADQGDLRREDRTALPPTADGRALDAGAPAESAVHGSQNIHAAVRPVRTDPAASGEQVAQVSRPSPKSQVVQAPPLPVDARSIAAAAPRSEPAALSARPHRRSDAASRPDAVGQAAAETVVHVTIGRIEVRADPAPVSIRHEPPAKAPVGESLDGWLKQGRRM
jgi:hypothetical protein